MKLEGLSCRRRVAVLCDYLDKTLPAAQRRTIAAHRKSCLPCREVLASLTRTMLVLKGLRAGAQVPASARKGWRDALAASKRRR